MLYTDMCAPGRGPGLGGICEFSLVVLRYGGFETQAPRGAFTWAVG